LGATLLIVSAAVIRAPIDDQCLPAAAAAGGTTRPVTSPPRARAEPAATGGDSAPAGTARSSPGGDGASAPVPAHAREARAKFSKDMQMRRIKEAVASLLQLLEVDPNAPTDGDVRGDIVELAMRVTLLEGGEPEAVFDAISNKMGTVGIDILWELMT